MDTAAGRSRVGGLAWASWAFRKRSTGQASERIGMDHVSEGAPWGVIPWPGGTLGCKGNPSPVPVHAARAPAPRRELERAQADGSRSDVVFSSVVDSARANGHGSIDARRCACDATDPLPSAADTSPPSTGAHSQEPARHL